jgi:hypothetical protein
MPDNADRKPTIDERLDRLTERHEALAETVELIVAMRRENEERFAKNEARFAQIAANQERDAERINALVRIVEIREHRLSGLEGDRSR